MTKSLSFDADVILGGNELADTDISLTHDLGRVPLEAFVFYNSRNSVVYRGSVAWTTKTISIRASAARTTFVLFLI